MTVTDQPLSKKQTVITELYAICKNRGNLEFDNEEVKAVCARVGFGNPFDATKLDNSAVLPRALVDDDVFVVHLGRGRHQFVYGIAVGYHEFESIPEERRYQWPYRRSLLNNINTSESNSLWAAFNQGVIHDFLYADFAEPPRIHFSESSQISLDCRIGADEVNATRVRVNLGFTAEMRGYITAFEAKHGDPLDFNVFRLFNSFRYYLASVQGLSSSAISGCYLLRRGNRLRFYLYSFTDSGDPGSIRLLRNAEYALVED